jgi:hypothetical protein
MFTGQVIHQLAKRLIGCGCHPCERRKRGGRTDRGDDHRRGGEGDHSAERTTILIGPADRDGDGFRTGVQADGFEKDDASRDTYPAASPPPTLSHGVAILRLQVSNHRIDQPLHGARATEACGERANAIARRRH